MRRVSISRKTNLNSPLSQIYYKMHLSVITFHILKELCQKYKKEIALGSYHTLPQITIRYLDSNRKFGYATFGNFFFFENDMYVWKTENVCKELHNQDIVEEIFNNKCNGRGYACRKIFAGVKTNIKDSDNAPIYTGDVLKVQSNINDSIYYLAVGSMIKYSFLLDNHSWNLSDCLESHTLKRIGSVFFQIDESEESEDVNYRVLHFNNAIHNVKDNNTKILMASYTPNTDQDVWKYLGLQILGIEPWFK